MGMVKQSRQLFRKSCQACSQGRLRRKKKKHFCAGALNLCLQLGAYLFHLFAFLWAVTVESNESMALNSLLMRVKATARYMFWRLGERVQENPSLTLDGFNFTTKNDSRFTLNGSPIYEMSSSVWYGAAWWTVHSMSMQYALRSLAWESLSVASAWTEHWEWRQQDPCVALFSDSKIKAKEHETLSSYKKYVHHLSLIVKHHEPNFAFGMQHVHLFVHLTEVQS